MYARIGIETKLSARRKLTILAGIAEGLLFLETYKINKI
jgi:hypothetical protein